MTVSGIKCMNLFTDLNDAAIARFVKEVDALAQIREQYREEFESNVASVRNLASNAKNQCNTEKNRIIQNLVS